MAPGSGCFSVVRIAGSTVDTVHSFVVGGFWMLFHTLQCEGGHRILRLILGQIKSMPVAIPQVQFLVKVFCPLLSCLMLLVRQCRKLWIFRSCRSRYFYDPLYLAVTCSAFACGVQDYGLFWKMTSGRFLFSILLGSTVDTCCVSLRRLSAWTSSLSSLSWCRGGFPWSCCSADHSSFPVAVH